MPFLDDPNIDWRTGKPYAVTDDQLFALMRKAFGPEPRLILSKSLAAVGIKSKAVKQKTAKATPTPVIVRKPQPSDRELAINLGDATVRGLISGTDALAAQHAVGSGRKLPAKMRSILLAAYGGKSPT